MDLAKEVEGLLKPWGDQTNIESMFSVRVDKEGSTYTLIQEGITLTDEQARQIYSAYKNYNK